MIDNKELVKKYQAFSVLLAFVDFEGEDNLEYGDRFMFYHYRSLLSDQGIDVSNIKNAKQLLQSLEAICEQLEIVIVELMKD